MPESNGPRKATVIVATAYGGPEVLSAVEEEVHRSHGSADVLVP